MDFLLSHWHCILPAIAIVVGLLLMRGKHPDSKEDSERRGAQSQQSIEGEKK